jgi:O-acetyl-ADP-ribose deacetylase (regulator of RNase III)
VNLHFVVGDITEYKGDVIVNAANEVMLGGGGVDGAIHRAAGPALAEACWQTPIMHRGPRADDPDGPDRDLRCITGRVVPTPAFDLDAKWVFHTVGPVWPKSRRWTTRMVSLPGFQMKLGATPDEVEARAKALLRSCYKLPMVMAASMGLQSIAYPAISAGDYGCPMVTCAKVVCKWAMDHASWPLDVSIYVFEETDLPTWELMADKQGLTVSGVSRT